MTVLTVNIPDDLEKELSILDTDLEAIVLEALRQYVASETAASDAEIESATAQDTSEDFLTRKELDYYLALP